MEVQLHTYLTSALISFTRPLYHQHPPGKDRRRRGGEEKKILPLPAASHITDWATDVQFLRM
jgi:hypothetical protein